MRKVPLEILVPIYNEGESVINLLKLFNKYIKTEFRLLFCYDKDDDDIFQFKKRFEEFSFEIELVKNPLQGPCEAIKKVCILVTLIV